MNQKKRYKEIKDRDLAEMMSKIRSVVGEDVIVMFKTTRIGSRFHGIYDEYSDYKEPGQDVMERFEDAKKEKKESYFG